MARKLKLITKAERERHHSRWYWLWLFRAAVLIVVSLLIFRWSHDYQVFSLLALSAAAVAWIYAWIHSQLEITCDSGKDDCKDDHALGKKTAFLKMGRRVMRGKKPRS